LVEVESRDNFAGLSVDLVDGQINEDTEEKSSSKTPGVFSPNNMGYSTHLDYIANKVVESSPCPSL
jgi:hypothetical protein